MLKCVACPWWGSRCQGCHEETLRHGEVAQMHWCEAKLSLSWVTSCGHPSCMIPLQSNLFIIFVSQIAGNSVAQIVGPYVNYLLRSQVYGVKILPSIYGKMRDIT